MIDLNDIEHIKLFQNILAAHLVHNMAQNSHFWKSTIKLGLMNVL